MRSRRDSGLTLLIERFGKNLRSLREARGFSQEALAERAGIHRTEVSLLERGGREPEIGTMLKLAAALGAPLDELAAGIEWRPPERVSSAVGQFRVTPDKDHRGRRGST